MGPLVPEIIGNELNLVVAIIIGIAFGFILEQAGFSSSKKLVGLFYGYDFTVLRVFFTAGLTAMFGVIALSYFGLLDMNLVYINLTFLKSAILGGLIMGLGFVIGGFCPGTSICAASIGKIDAMIFIGGSFLGVMIFAEGYPLIENLYKSDAWGNVTIFNVMGISQAAFAFLLIIVAVGAFWATTILENRVNGKVNPEFRPVKLYGALTAIAVVAAVSAFALPERKVELMQKSPDGINTDSFKRISIDELAFRLLDNDKSIQILDFRAKKDYDSLSLPNSKNYSLENLFEKSTNKTLLVKGKKNIFIADDVQTEKKAYFIAEKLGYTDLYILDGGFEKFRNEILYFKNVDNPKTQQEADTYKFRTKAQTQLTELIKAFKEKQKTKEESKPKRVVGGC